MSKFSNQFCKSVKQQVSKHRMIEDKIKEMDDLNHSANMRRSDGHNKPQFHILTKLTNDRDTLVGVSECSIYT